MHARRLPRIIPLALSYFIPFAHLVSSGPFDPQLWDLGAVEEVSSGQPVWDDAWTEFGFFWPEPPDSTSEYESDLLFAGNDPCHADADLWEWDSYSKIRRRQACDANYDPGLVLPTLDKLPDSNEGTISVEDLGSIFSIPLPQATSEEDEDDPLCPSDKTFGSKIAVCDSGYPTDTVTLDGVASSTLYNVQPCWFPPPPPNPFRQQVTYHGMNWC